MDYTLALYKSPEFEELTYPQPIVDHKFARERVLATFKKALGPE